MKKKLFLISIAIFCFFACDRKAVHSWVLWKRTIVQSQYRNTDQWETQKAFPTSSECMKQRDTRIKNDRAAFENLWKDKKDIKVEDIKTGVSYSGNLEGRYLSRTHSYTCLPEAVDPNKAIVNFE